MWRALERENIVLASDCCHTTPGKYSESNCRWQNMPSARSPANASVVAEPQLPVRCFFPSCSHWPSLSGGSEYLHRKVPGTLGCQGCQVPIAKLLFQAGTHMHGAYTSGSDAAKLSVPRQMIQGIWLHTLRIFLSAPYRIHAAPPQNYTYQAPPSIHPSATRAEIIGPRSPLERQPSSSALPCPGQSSS